MLKYRRMDKVIKNILKKIENEGYEAYIVGGFVRDKFLKRETYDVDICTNALPKELIKMFDIAQCSNGYGGFNFKIKKYDIDITTYRKEKKYKDRHPVEIEYVSSLFEDIKRRDFTINALCMDKNDNVLDLVEAKKDLDNHIIRIIGDANSKFIEDPLRILRAIRFSTVLDFDIEEKTLKSLTKNCNCVQNLSSERIREELDKILISDNYQKGLDIMKETGVASALGLSYDKLCYSKDIVGMWAQIDTDNISFSKTEKENITILKKIIKLNKIDNFDLFNYGLYLCLVAGQILNISEEEINKMYKKMPIHSMKEIAVSGDYIIKLLKIEPSRKISDIINDVKCEILNNHLLNRKGEIKKYIIRKWKNEQR